MRRFNDFTIMGFNIVPTQPFRYNYLGGKTSCQYLLFLTSQEEHFETSTTQSSVCSKQHHYMDHRNHHLCMMAWEPFLRFTGLTVSDFVPSINDEKYHTLKDWFENQNEGKLLYRSKCIK